MQQNQQTEISVRTRLEPAHPRKLGIKLGVQSVRSVRDCRPYYPLAIGNQTHSAKVFQSRTKRLNDPLRLLLLTRQDHYRVFFFQSIVVWMPFAAGSQPAGMLHERITPHAGSAAQPE